MFILHPKISFCFLYPGLLLTDNWDYTMFHWQDIPALMAAFHNQARLKDKNLVADILFSGILTSFAEIAGNHNAPISVPIFFPVFLLPFRHS